MKTQIIRLLSSTSPICSSCRLKLLSHPISTRHFSSTSRTLADPPSDSPSPPKSRPKTLSALAESLSDNRTPRDPPNPTPRSSPLPPLGSMIPPSLSTPPSSAPRPPVPHHLHIYAHNHNTHITLTSPQRQPIISVSTGNLNFRKAQRGTYDAAYQLGKYVMERIQQQGLLKQIESLEVVLRDFGPGREALTKVLLGSEGRAIRGRVVRVADATRLKFGGTRSKKPRRLG